MGKATKINDFRTLNLSEEKTPTKKNVGGISVSSNKKTNSRKTSAKGNNVKTSTKKKSTTQKKSVQKKEKEANKNSGLKLAIFFVILVLMGAFVGCLFTPTFNIMSISVDEGVRVTSNEIKSKVDEVIGENILRVNTKSLKESIESIPYVRRAEIKRNFPNELRITFKEREPYALIKHLESFVVMDKFGNVLEIKKENDMDGLAIIYGISLDEVTTGKKITDLSGLKYENMAYLLETVVNSKFEYTISEINYTDTEALIISVEELDVDINYGKIEKSILAEKINYLNGILKKLEKKKGMLDISSNNYLEKTIFTERY